jgi:anti-sigma-K factor RskA
MTAGERMSENRDCGGDAAAYVLGALEREEVEEFRRHMANCVVCRDEVAAFQRVADALPLAATQYKVPKGLRHKVLREVGAASGQAGTAVRRRRPFRPGAVLARPALAAGAVLVVAIAAIVGVELAGGGSSGTRVIQARLAGIPGTAQLRLSGGRAELIVRHVPAPPAGHIYEVWLERGSQPPSPTTTLFSVTSLGAADIGVPGNLRGVSEVLVTPEPAGGSLHPTHAPVIVAHLA